MGIHDRADVGRQLRVLVLAPPSTSRGEVLHTAHPLESLVQSFLNRLTTPAETSFGQSSTAAAQLRSHLGLEQAALVSGQSSRPGTKQGVEVVCGAFHVVSPPCRRNEDPRSTPRRSVEKHNSAL